jgi:pentose-5-phosphate-3-epimerase
MQVLPAILPKTYGDLLREIDLIKDITKVAQIDLVDTTFATVPTWLPTSPSQEIIFPENQFQIDLMVADWKQNLSFLMSMFKVVSAVFHIDTFTEDDCTEAFSWCEERFLLPGICINNDTDISKLTNVLDVHKEKVFVQVMGIRVIGGQGHAFDDICLARIYELRQKYPQLQIQVDGAMNSDTAKKVKQAGANTIVVGSYLFGSNDTVGRYEELSNS